MRAPIHPIRNLQIISLIFALVIISGCENKQEESLTPPEIKLNLSPASGTTTTIFDIDLSESTSGMEGKPVFYRWDWNNDGLWDTEFSQSTNYQHRFYNPGKQTLVVQAVNENYLSDSLEINIEVNQGYSKPRPHFSINPEKGNIITDFSFNASKTVDDEDPVENLRFRWDFNSDGIWDTGFSHDTMAKYRFQTPETYYVTLEACDSTDLCDQVQKKVIVDLLNKNIVPAIDYSPKNGTTASEFTFDASRTIDYGDAENQLFFKWDFNNDDIWDTEPSESATAKFRFSTSNEGRNMVKVHVSDSRGLYNIGYLNLDVLHANLPPEADFSIACPFGNTKTVFRFESNKSNDPEDGYLGLKKEWDFESDGIIDYSSTNYSFAEHQFEKSGRYTVSLIVTDFEQAKDTLQKTVDVYDFEYETGILTDYRDRKYYGTIKIGNQWWMSENLNYNTSGISQNCYQGNEENCEKYGSLYTWYDLKIDENNQKGICPLGWHIPNKAEVEELMQHFDNKVLFSDLLPEGSSGFHLVFGGMREPNGNFKYREQLAHFWTAERLLGSTNAMFMMFNKDTESYQTSFTGMSSAFSVKCIKDN